MEIDILNNKTIGIIGAGHMGMAILKGLLSSKKVTGKNIVVSNPRIERLHKLKKMYGIETVTNNSELAKKADWIIIAVKPIQMHEVITEIKTQIQEKIIISVSAKITIEMMKKYADNHSQKIIRVMPNIPVTCRKGIIGMYSSIEIHANENQEIVKMLSLLGQVIQLREEKEIDILTLLGGCGPAIIAYLLEILIIYGVSVGLSQRQSEQAVMQTMKGTLTYLEQSNMTPEVLQQSVATKGGITETILSALKNSEFRTLFVESMQQGYSKIKLY